MLTFGQGKVKVEISYGMLVSLGVIGFGLWYILRDDTKSGNGLLGFLKRPGQDGATGHHNKSGPNQGTTRQKRPSPPPPVPRSIPVDMDGGNGNDGLGGQSQRGSQGSRRF